MGSQKESKRILAKFSRGGVGNEGFVGCLPEEPEFTIPATYLLSCIVCSFVLSPCSCRLMQLVLSSLFLSCDPTSKSSNLCRVHTSLHPTYEDTNTFKYIQVISWHDYHHDLQHSARWCVRTFFFQNFRRLSTNVELFAMCSCHQLPRFGGADRFSRCLGTPRSEALR